MNIDGREVGTVRRPSSTVELSEMVASAGGAVAPVGAGTQLTFGNPLLAVDAAIDMTGLNRIIEYVPADMTIHLEAGVRLDQLRHTLAENNQILPLDPWCGGQATLGGVIATNAQGPFRTVGTMRDWIIGMRVVHADGRVSRTGGRVVKNVTGYDLAKLYTGSLGSLGVIADVSLKVRARYERTASARLRVESLAAARDLIGAIRSGPFDPVSFVWTGPPGELRIRFGEHRDAVAWQMGRLPAGEWEHADGDLEDRLWAGARSMYDAMPEPVARVLVRPAEVVDLVGRFQPQAWLAHIANGIVLMSVPEEQIKVIREEFSAILERAPLEVRGRTPTFGVRGTEYAMMRALKTALDPGGRLNPGRHVDGEAGR